MPLNYSVFDDAVLNRMRDDLIAYSVRPPTSATVKTALIAIGVLLGAAGVLSLLYRGSAIEICSVIIGIVALFFGVAEERATRHRAESLMEINAELSKRERARKPAPDPEGAFNRAREALQSLVKEA
jgi:hypothetical protein